MLNTAHQATVRQFILATRPRTYPIAIMSLGMGQSLAYRVLGGFGADNWVLCGLIIYTALSLQILSNLANDLGDGIRGTDHDRHRDSPTRLVGSGAVSADRFWVWVFGWLIQTMMAGSVLIWLSPLSAYQIVLFFGLGGVSILGALGYTMGKKPYGYHALGEFAVLIFFGYVAVIGGYYLQTGRADIVQNLPIATGVGLLSACVLYVNNLRDTDTDPVSGKMTLAVVLDRYKIVGYMTLLFLAVVCYIYHATIFGDRVWVLALCLPLLIKHTHAVITHRHNPARLGKELGVIVGLVIVMNVVMIGLVGV
ncbi:MAG: 1,4-dihydroxy-2-naphthoate octaprenyltransferase [Moraxella sp.]|nr:1,4-dihydroxy-2-naphthoate octaprenyltransferase [Moraxella sp.]